MKKNILQVLKMTAFYSFLGLIVQSFFVNILLASSSADGQSLRDITIKTDLNNITLEEAFKRIEDNSDFRFFYVKDEIPLKKEASIVTENKSLYEILENISMEFQLVFNRINNQITVKKQPEKVNTKPVQETGNIKGKIIYANSEEPVAGANIILIGTKMGSATDFDGNFVINNIPVGEYTIQISYIGCISKKETVRIVADKTVELNYALTQSLVNLDEVVVTGTLSERKIRAVANSISIISAEELENRNLSSFTTVLESVPGITLSPASESGGIAYSSIYIRGGAPLSNVVPGSGVKFIIDGVETADPSFLDYLNPNDIEKVEVARGPMASTIYGAGSSGGVIQIFTKRGKMGKLRLSLRTMLTTVDNKNLSSSPTSQNYTVSLSGGQGEFGYILGVDNTRSSISQYRRNNGIDNVSWNINSGVYARIQDISADLKYSYTRSTNGSYDYSNYYYAALEEGWNNPDAFLSYSYNDAKTVSQSTLTSLNLKQILSDNWYHNLTVGYSGNGFEQNNYTPMQVGPTDFVYASILRDFRKYSFKYFMNLNQSLSEEFAVDITGGLEYKDEKFVDAVNTYSKKQEDYKSQSEAAFGFKSTYPTSTTGLFAEAVWSFRDDLYLTTGVRTEKNSGYGDDLGWYTMPRVGLTYVKEFGEVIIKPRASLGKSSEPANPYYKVGSINPGWRNYLSNPSLKPQQQSGYELGADIYVSSFLSFNFTYYNQEISDLIVGVNLETTTDNTPNYQYQNIAKADNKGWEFSSRLNLTPFTLDLAYTSVTSTYGEGIASQFNPTYAQGKRIPDIPSGSFFARLSYYIPALLPWSGDCPRTIK